MKNSIYTPEIRLEIYLDAYDRMLSKDSLTRRWLYGLCIAVCPPDNYNRSLIKQLPELMVFKYCSIWRSDLAWWWSTKYSEVEDSYQSRLFALALAIAMVQDEIKLQK